MMTGREIRVHVRNKNRYNPETKERNFLFVDINDFAGTTIGDIKEDVRRQSRGAVRIDELFLDNQSLADDRSVAHYNLEDGCILETTSNPFWVSCLYIKASEVKQEMEGNPNDKHIQEWTQKSLPKKYTLIGVLLNAKNEYGRQPPHFSTLDEFAIYLERLNKKSATMHPEYTLKDMRAFEREYRQEFLRRYDDPIAAFIDHHAVRLGHVLPDEIEQRPLNGPNIIPKNVQNARNIPVAGRPKPGGRKKQERYCDDCEEALAEVYCTECQGGLAICRPCSAVLHAGATRRRHNLQDIEQAPSNNSKPYVPRAFLAPFSIVLAMYNALTTQSILSLTEDEIKRRAQPLTDTDLQDKQAGKYVGGFDCMENVLMNKGLVKKEAARVPTYALSASGQVLGQRLYTFYTQFYRFMESCRLPKVHNTARNGIIHNRKLCLIVDENERDKQRLLRYAAEKNIDAQVRLLPAGDYIWILTPPMVDPHVSYTGKDYGNELVLPFVVERKSWEDFENSTNTGRFKRQINNMLGSGLANCFYLMEGSTSGLRNNPTHHHQQYLKGLLEKLVTENGFYVNYTSSWMKSAQWLLWFTGFLVDGWRTGVFQDGCITYREYMSRVARQRGNTVVNSAFSNARRHTHTWKAQLFVDHIIRDSHGEIEMISTVQEDLGVTSRMNKHLLVIQNLEQYNKKRQSALNKCCEAVHADPAQARDIVEDRLGPVVHNMLHYDIASYWQLYMQVMAGVYVVRTETDQDTENIHRIFTSMLSVPTPSVTCSTAVPKATNRRPTKPRKSTKTATITSAGVRNPITDDPLSTEPNLLSRKRNPSEPYIRNLDTDLYDDDNSLGVRRRAGIHSIFSPQNNTSSPLSFLRDENEEMHSTAGHVIKKGRQMSENENDFQRQQKTAENHMIQPFSGQGYCLGTVAAEKHSRSETTVNKSKNTVQNQFTDLGRSQPGLVGGMWNSSNDLQDVAGTRKVISDDSETENFGRELNDVDQAGHNTDFVDSQNEDEVMKEILAKSAAEAQEMSNEDEMMKLAVEMSKQKPTPKTNDVIGNTSTDDEELMLALEMSKTAEKGEVFNKSMPADEKVIEQRNCLDRNSVVNLSEDEQLKHVLEMSKIETGRFQQKRDNIPCNRIELGDNENEDEMFKLAVEMSKTETNRTQGRIEKKLPPSSDEDEVLLIPDTEEDQMKLALEISKKETPIKLQNDSYRSRSENTGEHRKPCKRKHTDSQLYSGGKLAEHEHENLSEKEQLKIAMELSMSQVVTEDRMSSISDNMRIGLGKNLDKSMNSSKKLTNMEAFSIGLNPWKKSKHDQNYNEINRNATKKCAVEHFLDDMPTEVKKREEKIGEVVFDDESEDFKIAMARSKVEHSPVKKVKLGKQLFNEDEILKIVIERSKVEHSLLKKSDKEQSKKEVVSPSPSGIEVIEINSQNSQERDDDIVTPERDMINALGADSSLQKDTVYSVNREDGKRQCSNQRSMCSYQSPLVFPGTVCDDVGAGKHFGNKENNVSITDSRTGPRNSCISDRCSVNIEKAENIIGKTISGSAEKNTSSGESVDDADEVENVEDDDYIPPSPGRKGSQENVSFSQTFFSKTPEIISRKPFLTRASSCSPDRPSVDTQPRSSPQTSLSGQKYNNNMKSHDAIQESSRKLEDEVSDALGSSEVSDALGSSEVSDALVSSENLKTSVVTNKKFDIKSTLFYDSDDSDSESEADIFDGDEETATENQVMYSKDNEAGTEKDKSFTADRDFAQQNIAKGVKESLEVSIALESKKIDKALHNIIATQEDEGDTVIKSNDTINSAESNVKIDKIKDIDQLPKTHMQPTDDSQMSETDTQHQDDYLDYDDDDDNDIDYQPDSQDFNVKSESDSEGSRCSDLEENSQERNDLDLLPLIRRPRKIRYRQLKEEEKKIYELKREEKELEKLKSEIKIKTETVDKFDHCENRVTADELYARQLQNELDREAKQEGEKSSLIDDAYIARQLHETLNKEPALSGNESVRDNLLRSQSVGSSQHTYSRVNNERTITTDPGPIHTSPEHHSSETIPAIFSNKLDISDRQKDIGSNPEAVVRELQRRELEKIERWRKMLMEDERLAQRLQDHREDEAASTSSESRKQCSQSQQVETSFKKMVAQHKASKEKALAQLQQYRNLQMKRFQEVQDRSHSTSVPTNRSGNATFGQDNDVIVVKESQDNFAVPQYTGINSNSTRHNVTAPVNRTQFSENRQSSAGGNLTPMHTASQMNQPFNGGHMMQNSQSQPPSGSHMSQFNQSQSVDGDHVIQSTQSQSVVIKHSNVTCGNCGGKGHNRTFPKCPKYHTAEESARREVKLEKQRQQKEEKRKQEVETIHMLSDHKKMLEDMTSQIQREMGTIQNRLQQRSSELEAQVNLRVKKIENADKKKKK